MRSFEEVMSSYDIRPAPEELCAVLYDYDLLRLQVQSLIRHFKTPTDAIRPGICPNCKKKIDEGDRYCRICGKHLSTEYRIRKNSKTREKKGRRKRKPKYGYS